MKDMTPFEQSKIENGFAQKFALKMRHDLSSEPKASEKSGSHAPRPETAELLPQREGEEEIVSSSSSLPAAAAGSPPCGVPGFLARAAERTSEALCLNALAILMAALVLAQGFLLVLGPRPHPPLYFSDLPQKSIEGSNEP